MKPGDLVRFTREHASRPGLGYTATWMGLVCEKTSKETAILWTYSDLGGGHFIARYDTRDTDPTDGDAFADMEVISEK
jgi:hypothetical protein